MNAAMRSLGMFVFVVMSACGTDTTAVDPTATQTFAFGPFAVEPGTEISDQCVQITLHNDHDLYINQVELTTGPGFHHSNWVFVPENVFRADDGTNTDGVYKCTDRHFDQQVGAVFGGVLFAQSTQSPHEVQTFPAGAALKIPAHFKLAATIHLLNPGDTVLDLTPTIALTPIAPADVTTLLAGFALEDHALGIPPQQRSRFTVTGCDIATPHQTALGRAPDFKIYHALAHYHSYGTGLSIEAVRPDNTTATIFTTGGVAGDSLGATLDPPFDMTGFTGVRFSCDYYNTSNATVVWGLGSQEMCVFLAFTDSPLAWGGGAVDSDPPGPVTDVNGVMSYSHDCTMYHLDASR
jgi:hypothetical protein